MKSISNNSYTVGKKQFRRGFKKEADLLAIEYRNKLGLKPQDPLPALQVAKLLQLTVKTPSEICGMTAELVEDLLSSEGRTIFSAVTIGIEKPVMIIHNPYHSPARQESNIMHECAHVMLNHQMAEFDNTYGFLLRQYDQEQENEAEWLGGCLQLPKEALIKHFIFNSRTIEEISEIFTASIQMVRFRIGLCGIEAMKKAIQKKNYS